MATLRAVVEIEPWADEYTPWPIEKTEPLRWEVLNGSTASATIGTAMARLARWCQPEELDVDYEPTAAEALQWIAAADYLVISAGIQASDADPDADAAADADADPETIVNPGCCADLEGWRAWPDTWLGHPAPQIKQIADGMLIREDEKSQSPVMIAAGTLPGLLAGVREDLIAFLHTAERWITATVADPELAAAVIANIDRHVIVTAPLDQR